MQIIEGNVAMINEEVTESYHSSSNTWKKSTLSFVSLDSTYAWYHGRMKAKNGDKLVLVGKKKRFRNHHGFAISAYYNLSQQFISIYDPENGSVYLWPTILLACGALAGYGASINPDKVGGFITLSSSLSAIGLWMLILTYRQRIILKKLKKYIEKRHKN